MYLSILKKMPINKNQNKKYEKKKSLTVKIFHGTNMSEDRLSLIIILFMLINKSNKCITFLIVQKEFVTKGKNAIIRGILL